MELLELLGRMAKCREKLKKCDRVTELEYNTRDGLMKARAKGQISDDTYNRRMKRVRDSGRDYTATQREYGRLFTEFERLAEASNNPQAAHMLYVHRVDGADWEEIAGRVQSDPVSCQLMVLNFLRANGVELRIAHEYIR